MYHTFEWTPRSLDRNDLTRNYEPLQPHLLMALAARCRCDTFLDVGANIGVYSLLMSRVPGITSIHAFEPAPETFEELRKNVALNRAAIATHNRAVSDRPATLTFGIVDRLSGANSVIDTSIHQRFERQIEVEAVRLGDFLPDRDRRICIKVDVEGHERKALAGMQDLLARNRVVLQIEDYGEDDAELSGMLGKLGLRPLFRVGADRYFANVETSLTDRDIVELFETAAKQLVASNLALLQAAFARERPITLSLNRDITLQVGGWLAKSARAGMRRLRRN